MSDNSLLKAIAESATEIAMARAETRKRRMWAYIRIDTLTEWAGNNNAADIPPETQVRQFFEAPATAEVRTGIDGFGAPSIAVWVGKGPVQFEPSFIQPEDAEASNG